MSHDLFLRQLRKSAGLGAEAESELSVLDPVALARRLQDLPPEALGHLVEDVRRTYREGDATRERLNHVLRVSSCELFETNRELERQLGLLGVTLDSTPDGVIAVDLERRVLVANERCSALWGVPREALRGRRCADLAALLAPQLEDPAGFLRTFEELAQSEVPRSDEMAFTDGRVFERHMHPIGFAGRLAGRLYLFRDVTAARKAERERAVLEEQFRQSQKMEAIGQLAGGVAHDFNNLLTVINGYAELLVTAVDPGTPLYVGLREIGQAGARAAALTQQLLAFSRKQVLAPKVVDLAAIIVDMERMLCRLIGEGIELMTVNCDPPPRAKVDPTQMEQVVLNLVVNARDAIGRGGGEVRIETACVDRAPGAEGSTVAAAGRWICVSVSDTGAGMDPETQARVFEPFFTTKQAGHGTGLGLSTVYGIVKQSGGSIEVESKPGRGTTFRVYLPSVEDLPVGTDRREGADDLRGQETVLVVDDDEPVRALASAVLRARGYRVLDASPSDAIAVCRRHAAPIDLLLTDVVMPRGGGRRVYEAILAIHREVRVLYMSGHTEDALRKAALQPGVAFIHKPFTPGDLARGVREALDRAEELATA